MKNKYSVKSYSNRIPVTAQWLWDNAGEETAYIKSGKELGSWIEVTGVDATRDGSEIILQYGRRCDKRRF